MSRRKKRRREVTQADIAKIVGVNTSTVNKILSEVPGSVFSEATKKKVFKVAARLGYMGPRRGKKRMMDAVRALLSACAMSLVQLREKRIEAGKMTLETALSQWRELLS